MYCRTIKHSSLDNSVQRCNAFINDILSICQKKSFFYFLPCNPKFNSFKIPKNVDHTGYFNNHSWSFKYTTNAEFYFVSYSSSKWTIQSAKQQLPCWLHIAAHYFEEIASQPSTLVKIIMAAVAYICWQTLVITTILFLQEALSRPMCEGSGTHLWVATHSLRSLGLKVNSSFCSSTFGGYWNAG